MKERDVLKTATDMLDRFGWEWWHVPAPMVAGRAGQGWRPYRKAAGLPDIFAFSINPPRMLILELKGDKGRLSPDQRRFLTFARDVADMSYTWTNTALDAEKPRLDGQKMLGVYVVEPGNLDALEQMLRSKVLT